MDRLKKWEPVRHKNELAQLNSAPFGLLHFCPAAFLLLAEFPIWGNLTLLGLFNWGGPPSGDSTGQAYFCAPGLPIVPKAQPWDPRLAGFPAILASQPGHPVNPV